MGIIIIFRNSSNINLFRDYLHTLISLHGEKLILSSGFIAEGNRFSLLDSNNMLHPLSNAVHNGLSKIIVIAGKFNTSFGRRYRQKFDNFAKKLSTNFGNVVVKIPQDRWHAKVSILISNKNPIAAIIGSSNLTTTAYGINQGQNWNRECDVVIWDNRCKEATNKFREIYKEGENVIYFRSIRDKFNEEFRLKKLYEEIRNMVGEEYRNLI